MRGAVVYWSHCAEAECKQCNHKACVCCYSISGVDNMLRIGCNEHADRAPSCSSCAAFHGAHEMLSPWGGLSVLSVLANAFFTGRNGIERRGVAHTDIGIAQIRAPQHAQIPQHVMQAAVDMLYPHILTRVNTHCNSMGEFLLRTGPTVSEHETSRRYFLNDTSPKMCKTSSFVNSGSGFLGRRWKSMDLRAHAVHNCTALLGEERDSEELPVFTIEGGAMSLFNRELTIALPCDACFEFGINGDSAKLVGTATLASTAANSDGISKHPYFCIRMTIPVGCKDIRSSFSFKTYACNFMNNNAVLHDQHRITINCQCMREDEMDSYHVKNSRLELMHAPRFPTPMLENVGWPAYIHESFLRNQKPPFPVNATEIFSSLELSQDLDMAVGLLGTDILSMLWYLLSASAFEGFLSTMCTNAHSKALYLDHMFVMQMGVMPSFSKMYHDAVDLMLELSSDNCCMDFVRCMHEQNENYHRDRFENSQQGLYTLSREMRTIVFSEIVAEVASNLFLDCINSPLNIFYHNFNLRQEILRLRKMLDDRKIRLDVCDFIAACSRHAHRALEMPSPSTYLDYMTAFNADFSHFLAHILCTDHSQEKCVCN